MLMHLDPTQDDIKTKILAFETHILPQTFNDNWSATRSEWIQKVKEATLQVALANTVLTLEESIQQSMLVSNWKGCRKQWIERVSKDSVTSEDVMNFLLKLEDLLTPESMGGRWPSRRNAWRVTDPVLGKMNLVEL